LQAHFPLPIQAILADESIMGWEFPAR